MSVISFKNKNINNYRSAKGGRYFIPGQYVVRLLSAKGIEYGQNNPRETAFVAEFEILSSNNEAQPAGDKPSHFVKLSDAKFPDTALGNVADCMRAMICCREVMEGGDPVDPEKIDVDDDVADAIIGDDQPMVGTIMGVDAVNIKTRAGNDFTKISYFVPDDLADYGSAVA